MRSVAWTFLLLIAAPYLDMISHICKNLRFDLSIIGYVWCLVNNKWLIIISLYEVLKVHVTRVSVMTFLIVWYFSTMYNSESGAEGIRTPDPLLARQVLSQLSYNPLGLFYFILNCFRFLYTPKLLGLSGPFLHLNDYPNSGTSVT